MKINSIEAYRSADDEVSVSVRVTVAWGGDNAVHEAIAAVAAKLTDPNVVSDPLVEQAIERTRPATEPTVAPTPSTEPVKRTRRTAAQMAEANAQVPNPPPPTQTAEVPSRRRRAPETSPDPMPISDAELSKAASNAAEAFVKLGEDGPTMVKLVLEDFKVETVGDIPADQREKFIKELAKEVSLAQAEHDEKVKL